MAHWSFGPTGSAVARFIVPKGIVPTMASNDLGRTQEIFLADGECAVGCSGSNAVKAGRILRRSAPRFECFGVCGVLDDYGQDF